MNDFSQDNKSTIINEKDNIHRPRKKRNQNATGYCLRMKKKLEIIKQNMEDLKSRSQNPEEEKEMNTIIKKIDEIIGSIV